LKAEYDEPPSRLVALSLALLAGMRLVALIWFFRLSTPGSGLPEFRTAIEPAPSFASRRCASSSRANRAWPSRVPSRPSGGRRTSHLLVTCFCRRRVWWTGARALGDRRHRRDL